MHHVGTFTRSSAHSRTRPCRCDLHDADAQASGLRGRDQHDEQLSRGRFHGTLDDLQTGKVHLLVEQASQATWQSGQPRPHT